MCDGGNAGRVAAVSLGLQSILGAAVPASTPNRELRRGGGHPAGHPDTVRPLSAASRAYSRRIQSPMNVHSGGSRTHDTRVISPLLYPAELPLRYENRPSSEPVARNAFRQRLARRRTRTSFRLVWSRSRALRAFDRRIDLQNDSSPRRNHTERGPESVRARCDVNYRDRPSPSACAKQGRGEFMLAKCLFVDVLANIGCAIWAR